LCGIKGLKAGLGRKETLLTPWVFFLPTCPWIEWVLDGVEDEDTSFASLDAIEEDFYRVNKGK
jgi:hypothetical protein